MSNAQDCSRNNQDSLVDPLLIFGAAEDVVSRLFLPALVGLAQENTLPGKLSITAIARTS